MYLWSESAYSLAMVISFPNMAEQLASDCNLKQKQKKLYVLTNFYKKIYTEYCTFLKVKKKSYHYLPTRKCLPYLVANKELWRTIKLGQIEGSGMSAGRYLKFKNFKEDNFHKEIILPEG